MAQTSLCHLEICLMCPPFYGKKTSPFTDAYVTSRRLALLHNY